MKDPSSFKSIRVRLLAGKPQTPPACCRRIKKPPISPAAAIMRTTTSRSPSPSRSSTVNSEAWAYGVARAEEGDDLRHQQGNGLAGTVPGIPEKRGAAQ